MSTCDVMAWKRFPHYWPFVGESAGHLHMMTSSKFDENIFCVTGPLCGEFTGHRWIPRTKARGAELWCFLWSAPEQTVEQTIETLVIWDIIALIVTSLQWKSPHKEPVVQRFNILCHYPVIKSIRTNVWTRETKCLCVHCTVLTFIASVTEQ